MIGLSLKRLFVVCSLLFTSFTFAAVEGQNTQMMGAQIYANHAVGYGLYVVRMKPSDVPGVISSFFLFSTHKLWPKSWREVDLEFTPGYETSHENRQKFVLDNSRGDNSCFDPSGNYQSSFFQSNCRIQDVRTQEVKLKDGTLNSRGQSINRALAFNTYGNTPLVENQSSTPGKGPIVQRPGDMQVFYIPEKGINPFDSLYNYYIWYTPQGLFWSGPSDEREFPFPGYQESPAAHLLPLPQFAKLWNSNRGGEEGQDKVPLRFGVPNDLEGLSEGQKDALAYHADQFTPLDQQTGLPLPFGAQMNLMINIWDGIFAGASEKDQPWGGYQRANHPTHSVYQKIAFFPMKGVQASNSVGKGSRYPAPMDYHYGPAEQYSDFSYKNTGLFFYKGQKVSFNQLWVVDDGYAFPLGIYSGFSVFCSSKQTVGPEHFPGPQESLPGLYLQLRNPQDFAIPRRPAGEVHQNNFHTNCLWADNIGL